MPADLAVIVTARNEADRLPSTLRALHAAFPGADVWVADDASGDATAHVALQEGARLVRAPRRIGKGGVATLAADAVLLEHASTVVLADGDLGDSARELRALVEALGDADLAVAKFSRRVGGGVGLAVGSSRRATRRATGTRLDAPLSGQRAMTAQTLRMLLPFAPGFGMETAMNIDALRAGLRVVEVELDLEHRATGRTPGGFLHRGKQLRDIVRAYASRRK
jgi:glycosyltransferase involved in cell wall biosynthesis